MNTSLQSSEQHRPYIYNSLSLLRCLKFKMLHIMIPDQYPNYYKAVEMYTGYLDSLEIAILLYCSSSSSGYELSPSSGLISSEVHVCAVDVKVQ